MLLVEELSGMSEGCQDSSTYHVRRSILVRCAESDVRMGIEESKSPVSRDMDEWLPAVLYRHICTAFRQVYYMSVFEDVHRPRMVRLKRSCTYFLLELGYEGVELHFGLCLGLVVTHCDTSFIHLLLPDDEDVVDV